MNSPRPPSRDFVAKVWELHCRMQTLDMELLSLEADNPEHAERTKTIMASRDDLWREKCAITDRVAGIEPRKKRKLAEEVHEEPPNVVPYKVEPQEEPRPERQYSREQIFDLVDNLNETESNYEDDNVSEFDDEARVEENGAGSLRNGGVAIGLDPESQHGLDVQAQIQSELFPLQDSTRAEQKAETDADDESEAEEVLELMEIDADTFNAACQKNSLQRENKQLRRKLEKAERQAKLLYPLVVIGIQIRRRHLEHAGSRFGVHKQHLVIQHGNQAAHEANILADMAMLDELGPAGDRYHEVMTVMYKSVWSPRRTLGWEDISWNDKNCQLLSVQATCRQENINEMFLQPELGALLKRIKLLADSVGGDLPILNCPAKRAKINADREVESLLDQLWTFLRPNIGNQRARVLQRPTA